MSLQVEALCNDGKWDMVSTYVKDGIIPAKFNTRWWINTECDGKRKQGVCYVPPRLPKDVFAFLPMIETLRGKRWRKGGSWPRRF